MVTLKEQIPKPLRTPVSLGSYVLGLLGSTVGWILTILGITLYFELYGTQLNQQISDPEAFVVMAVGLLCAGLGMMGLKGYMYFSY